MEMALTTVISKAEMDEVTIANLMRMVELKTTKILVLKRHTFNNKYALEPMLYLISLSKKHGESGRAKSLL